MEILTFEGKASDIIAENPNMMIPYYIMASYAYYVQDNPIFSDSFYDELAKTILDYWGFLNHRHKHYLNEDALKAGSYLGEYPLIAEGAVNEFRKVYSRSNSRKRK